MVGVYNGKQYINVEIKPEMIGTGLSFPCGVTFVFSRRSALLGPGPNNSSPRRSAMLRTRHLHSRPTTMFFAHIDRHETACSLSSAGGHRSDGGVHGYSGASRDSKVTRKLPKRCSPHAQNSYVKRGRQDWPCPEEPSFDGPLDERGWAKICLPIRGNPQGSHHPWRSQRHLQRMTIEDRIGSPQEQPSGLAAPGASPPGAVAPWRERLDPRPPPPARRVGCTCTWRMRGRAKRCQRGANL